MASPYRNIWLQSAEEIGDAGMLIRMEGCV